MADAKILRNLGFPSEGGMSLSPYIRSSSRELTTWLWRGRVTWTGQFPLRCGADSFPGSAKKIGRNQGIEEMFPDAPCMEYYLDVLPALSNWVITPIQVGCKSHK